ncbi:MAG: RluA family pseudouridine synthase [Acidobacteria bacterium]|nr:RluA family pseudouridine synthase [Acidobacteriota bacterium]MBI3281033.1 RluA family pseudouridine synthase [Acidobacteriota bacterium]
MYSVAVYRTLHAGAAAAGKRLDQFLHQQLPEYSRSRLQAWIKEGRVKVDALTQKPSYLLRGAETISVEPAELPPLRAVPEQIPLEVLYAGPDVIAVNKPAGMVVHAGAGRSSGTLVNALLHHFGSLSNVSGEERPGIVHRLDKDTSGVLVVARTDAAHRALAHQFAGRTVEKLYTALVQGEMNKNRGVVETPITRDPLRRTRMTARLRRGRSAHTEYRVLRRYQGFSLIEVKIATGRTHQIRAHLASIGHPVAGDKLYGARPGPVPRFFLHAARISFTSPSTEQRIRVESPLPAELEAWLANLDKLSGDSAHGRS